jgi:hypothetical protein
MQTRNMKKEFIPYEQALALKELGFDEPCLMYFSDKSKELLSLSERDISFVQGTSNSTFTKAPLFQQAFRWFREKYDLHINKHGNSNYTSFNMVEPKIEVISFVRYTDTENHYEEAELECLKKLIEIVKNG